MTKNGPLAKNHSTGKIERMVEEEYEVKVWNTTSECEPNCIQTPGAGICKTHCSAWEIIQARIKDGTLPFKMQKRTRFVFKEI